MIVMKEVYGWNYIVGIVEIYGGILYEVGVVGWGYDFCWCFVGYCYSFGYYCYFDVCFFYEDGSFNIVG